MRLTTKAIHDELQRRGHDVYLEKGDGYFYFRGAETNEWLDKTVNVRTLSSLTLDKWIAEFMRLRKLNKQLQSGPTRPASPRSKQDKA